MSGGGQRFGLGWPFAVGAAFYILSMTYSNTIAMKNRDLHREKMEHADYTWDEMCKMWVASMKPLIKGQAGKRKRLYESFKVLFCAAAAIANNN